MIDTAKLKKRISLALANDNIGSAELLELVSEAEQAANAANDAAIQARAKAKSLDADPAAAAESITVGEISRDQLTHATQQLRELLPNPAPRSGSPVFGRRRPATA